MTEHQKFTLAMFSPHVGSRFQLEHESGVECILELVEAVGLDSEDPRRPESFSLVFLDPAASADSYLPQAIYTLKHEALGTLQISSSRLAPPPAVRECATKRFSRRATARLEALRLDELKHANSGATDDRYFSRNYRR
jgi:hypothetical protein